MNSLPANIANVGFITGVCSTVVEDVAARRKLLRTDVALERFLPGMRSHVIVKVLPQFELLSAYFTDMGTYWSDLSNCG